MLFTMRSKRSGAPAYTHGHTPRYSYAPAYNHGYALAY
jgi:hypothetical protein